MEGVSPALDPISQIVTYLLSFGLPGVCLIVLGWAYKNKDKRVDDLTDTMAAMAREQGKGLADATASINRLSDLLLMRNKTDQ